jgi:peptidyl-prolyl cis-trans isomerase C
MFTTVKARHILIRAGEDATPEAKQDAKTKIDDIAKQIEGGADFSELAKAESQDPGSGARGGDLGEFGPGQMVPPFEQAAFALEAGEVSDVVETQFGYHIIKVDEKNSASLDEVREQLKNGLEMRQREMVLQEWIGELSEKADIQFPGQQAAPGQPESPAAGTN